MHFPFDFIFELWHMFSVSAVVGHGAVLAALLLSPADVFKNCWMTGKLCRASSEAGFCCIRSGLCSGLVCLKGLFQNHSAQ